MVRLSPAERADAQRKAGIAGLSLSALARAALAAFEPRSRIAHQRNAIRETAPDVGIKVVYDDEEPVS